jgi:hypothetical protein
MRWTATFQSDVLPAPTWRERINPLWWLSDQERNPAWPWLKWFLRNPCANLFGTIIGVSHHKRWYVSTMDGSNFPLQGWGMAWVIADACLIPRPWIAWRGRNHEFGAGWKSHGGFGINWRRANSTNATPEYHR